MSIVRVRVWSAAQGDERPDLDIEKALAETVRIWRALGVTLEPEKARREVTITAAGDRPGPELDRAVAEELAAALNPVIGKDREGWLDVVLLPRFGNWGRSYSPLNLLTPRTRGAVGKQDVPAKPGAYAPFIGPVAIVSSRWSVPALSGGVSLDRAVLAQPADEQPVAVPLVVAAVANDIAHEIGHLFGLWHTSELTRELEKTFAVPIPTATMNAYHLMYETLYSRPMKCAPGRTGANALAAVKGLPKDCRLTVATSAVGPDEKWYVVLRGELVDPADLKAALANVDTKLVWQ